MINLEFQSARTLWLIVLPIAALAVVWWTYRRTYPPVGGCYRWLLLLLRSAAVVLLGLLIFEPLLGLSRERTRPARVAVLIDRSASMLLPADAAKGGAGEDPSGKSRLERAREILETQERGSRVDLFSFGSRFRSLESPAGLGEKEVEDRTDLASALEALGRSAGEETGGGAWDRLYILSDGAVNAGSDPLLISGRLPPVDAVVVGAPVSAPDAALKSLEVRGPVFSGGEIKLEFSLAVTPPADPETGYPQAAVLDFYSGGRKIGEKSVRLGEGIRRFVSGKVSLPAPEEAGEYWLHAIVRPLEGEWTAANNERLIKVTVSRDRRRIFLLSSSPDWDFYFMQRSLALDEDLEVQAMLALEPGHGGRLYRFRDSEGKFSAGRLPDAAALEDIELVVLHGEWARFDRSFLLRIADRAAQGSLALVFWPVGPLDTGEGLKKLARYLPFRDSRVSPPLVKGPDAPCVLFTTDRYGILKSLGRGAPINDLPPVDRVYRSLPLKASAVVLARTGREQAAATTPGAHKAKGEVLLAALQVGGTRVAAILGQGLWRWHMLSQDASVGRDNLYERLWAALAEWLLSGEKGEKLFLKPRRNVFLLGETVVFDGELGETAPGERDKESGTVMVTVWQEKDKGAADTVAALKVEARGEAGSLEVQLGRLQPGVYLYEAVAAGSGSPPLSSRGTFAAENYNPEMAEAGPDTTILAGLVRATKGKLTMDYKNAETKIRADEITEPVLKTYRLAYRVWVYLVLILLLSAEWALRRRKALA